MKKRRLSSLKNGKQLLNYARRSENYAGERVEGSHHIVHSKRGGFVVIPIHGNKELAIGTRNSIIKRMLAIGLSVLVLLLAWMWSGGA
ncbi:type II toxin-antitoxin system HicA family toxin [Anaerolineae bacterium CFX7]|nr:type II toxin-antitoxin system HicA family toxin [Anaerolineae bacterium CFX7]